MDDITKEGLKFVPDDIKKAFIGDSETLMKNAISFIQKLESIVNDCEHLGKIMNAGGGQDNLSRLRQSMKQSQDALTAAITAQYDFEEAVNNFLGRQIHFAWIDVDTAEVFLVEEVSAKQIYKLASLNKNKKETSGFTGRIDIKNNTDLNNFKNKLKSLPSFMEEGYKNSVNERVAEHQQLIKTILSRLDDNLNKRNLPWYKEHNSTVYWQHPPQGMENIGKWSWSIATKKGFISQGYVRFVFNSKENLAQISEYNIGRFMMNYVEKADKIPAIVKGDIIVSETNDNIQIAVKSNKLFSTASIGPYITTAYQIIQFYDNTDNLTIETVQSILKNLQNYPVGILKASQERATENLKKIFEDSGATVT